jgi:2'-5' RNA ligase
MRLFYASFLAPENMSAYESLVDSLRAEVTQALRPIPARTHHLTLAFLGEVADGDVDKCLEILESVKGSPTSSLSLGHPRILYGRGRPRLICTDLAEGGEQVARLQQLLCDEILQVLPSLDLRPKPPHVTLARFNKKANRQIARKVEEALARHEDAKPTRTDRLVAVRLVKSSLTATGPIYESLGEATLPETEPAD